MGHNVSHTGKGSIPGMGDGNVLLENRLCFFNRKMIEQLTKAQENNTLGYRLITTLLHQYFIKGGFVEKETKKVTFQQKLTFNKV